MLRAVALLMAVVGLTACEVDATVAVVVDEDGSGLVSATVSLDAETVDRLGDPAEWMVVDDLSSGGWTVVPPVVTEEGALVEASKPFGRPEDLARVLAEIAGPDTLFRDVDLTLEDGFAATDYRLEGTVATTGSLTEFGDQGLADLLDGERVGYSAEELATLLSDTDGRVGLAVTVTLPGAESTTHTLDLGGGLADEVSLAANSTRRSTTPSFWLAMALGAGLAALAVVGLGRISARRRVGSSSTPTSKKRTIPRPGSTPE